MRQCIFVTICVISWNSIQNNMSTLHFSLPPQRTISNHHLHFCIINPPSEIPILKTQKALSGKTRISGQLSSRGSTKYREHHKTVKLEILSSAIHQKVCLLPQQKLVASEGGREVYK
jgi:hypothetical protein